MDATLSYGLPRINESGTLLEGIALWGELKPMLVQEAIISRALTYCDWAVANGLLAIRTHVDTCDPRLLAVEALLEVKRQVAPYLDLQLVAFPQDGILRYDPRGRRSGLQRFGLRPAEEGARPRRRRGRRHPALRADDAVRQRNRCGCCARRRRGAGLRVDMHCDETDDPMSRHIETLAFEARRLGLQGRVNGSHLTSMHSMDNYYVSKLIPLIAAGRRVGDRQPADQHHHPGPARYLSQAARHDPGAGAAGRRACRSPSATTASWIPGTDSGRATCWRWRTWACMWRR